MTSTRIPIGEIAAAEDPYPVYDRLRGLGPLVRVGPNQWMASRYKVVTSLLSNPMLRQFQVSAYGAPPGGAFESQRRAGDSATRFTERIVASQDDAAHIVLRKLIATALKPTFSRLETLVENEVARVFAELPQGVEVDAVEGFALPLSLRVVGRVIGLPDRLLESFGRQALRIADVFSPNYSPEPSTTASTAIDSLRGSVADLLRPPLSPSEGPGQEFLRLFYASAVDRLSAEDIVDNIIFLLFAGLETSVSALGNLLDQVVSHVDLQAALKADSGMIHTTVEEALRIESPVHITARIATQDMDIFGQSIRRGRLVYLNLAAANRDPDEFTQPDIPNFTRAPNPHVAFGAGAHYCLGAAIARRESLATLRQLVRSQGSLRRASISERHVGFTLRSLKRLSVVMI